MTISPAPAPDATGFLVVNADDWGRDERTTDRILDCVKQGTVTAVSAMVFMEDSARAAALALAHSVDVGLHLNLTTVLSAPSVLSTLSEHHRRLATFLRRPRYSYPLFNPALTRSFDYVVKAQLDEFARLFGRTAVRVDGHHHAHLCANVLFQRLLPAGAMVRRSFSFEPGQPLPNRVYRRIVDGLVQRRHRAMDGFFSIAPLEPVVRLQRIAQLARTRAIELETHPVVQNEYEFLMGRGAAALTQGCRVMSFAALSQRPV